jgi:hypothetical protein
MKKNKGNIKKQILLALLLFVNIIPSFSQSCTDMMKYWYYRNRLKYFVVPGEKIGESQIICTRNKLAYPESEWLSDNVDYGQHGKHDGLYIGVLATEHYLLEQNGQYDDAANTLKELYYSLYAVKTYWDSLAEPFYGSYTASWDGFFIRGNVPCDFFDTSNPNGNGFTINGESHTSILNKGLDPTNDLYNPSSKTFGIFPRGHVGYITHRTSAACSGGTSGGTPCEFNNHPESMSQDEAIIILMGCALAVKCTDEDDEDSIHTLAKNMADKIIKEVLNIDYQSTGENYCRIYDPAGNKIPGNKGGSTLGYSPGFLESGYQITGDHWYRTNAIWEIFQIPNQIAWQAAIRSASDQDLTATILAMGNYSPGRIAGLTNDKKNWDTFYLLLWEVLNDKKRNHHNQEELLDKTLTQLDAAPCSGPYCYKIDTKLGYNNYDTDGVHASGGWATDYRWFKRGYEQDHGDWCTGNYNGLDYMLLYNLYHIKTKDYSPYYVNYNDKKLVGTVDSSTNFVGYNSINSTQEIQQASVTYKAGDNIHLKAGFHAIAGSNFHALIGEINCSDGSGYPDNMYTNYYDSLISLPKQTCNDIEDADTTFDNNIYITMPCPIDTIKFEGLFGDSTDYDYTYYWDFGNGQTSTLRCPKIFYNSSGTFHFTVIRTDTNSTTLFDDSSDIADTFNIYITVPDCKLYGYLYENLSCGGTPVSGDSLYITWNNNHVATVNPAVSGIDGYFHFNSSQILQLDTTKSYTITTYSGISIDGMMAHPISYWIANSPLTLHYTTSVNLEWEARYNGADSLEDVANAIDLEGNVYVTGTTNTDASDYEILTIKYNPLGDTLWTKKYHGTVVHHNDIARAITVDAYGNAYVAGESYPADLSMLTVLKYNTSGTLCWARTYYRTNTTAKCIQLDNDGNVIVGGIHLLSANGTVFTILKYDPAGTLLWTKDYYGNTSPPDNVLSSITIDSGNNVYATGYSKNSAGNYDIYTVKSDGVHGDSLWVARYNNPDGGNDYGYSNTLDSHENIIVAGYSHRSNNTDQVVIRSYNHNNGNVKWTSIYNTDTYDYAYKVLYNNAGYIYTAGSTGDATNSSMLALKYDTSGTLQWHQSTLAAHPFVFKSAALDQADNVYVTGSSKPTTFSTSDIVTQKLNNANTVLWTQTYNGVGGFNDIPVQVTVSQNGNVYVCGESYGNNTNYDFTTLKYSQCESTADLLKLGNENSSSANVTTSKENSSVQVIPNPNNGNMTVSYDVPEGQTGLFTLYDITGRQLMNFVMFSGKNSFAINGSNLNKGIYFYKAIAGNKLIGTDKIVVIK